MKNYHNSLLEHYIIAIENPDSNGWDPQTRTWGHATGKGMDHNQIGIGGDRNNVNIKATVGTRDWDKVRITEVQEREARYKNFDYCNSALNRNTKGIKLSNLKRMMAMGLLYHGYGPLLWDKGQPLNNALRNGSDDEFSKTITTFYSDKYPERSRNHQKFMNKLKDSDAKKPRISLKTIPAKSVLGYYTLPSDATRVMRIEPLHKIHLYNTPTIIK